MTATKTVPASEPRPYQLPEAPPIAVFPEDTLISVPYRTDLDALAALLPPGFDPVAPVIQFRYRRSANLDWIDGGVCNSIGVAAKVRFAADPPAEGIYWIALWEDDFIGAVLGRTLMGVAKRFGEVNGRLDPAGSSNCILSIHGWPAIELAAADATELEGEALDVVRSEAGAAGTVLGLKEIPAIDQSEVELRQVTSYPIATEVRRAWRATGSARVLNPQPDVLRNERHVLEPIAALPLLENLGALVIEASTELRVADGVVLSPAAEGPG